MTHTITSRSVRRLEARRKNGTTKQRLITDPDFNGRKKGDRRMYAGIYYKDGDDRVSVLHPTKGWRNYSIDNSIIGI